jgi:tRNA pseudouridine32 synthase/23S rRNA pseudouridine746 synthase
MQRRLSRMFQLGEVEKRYIAVASGLLDEAGEIDLPIAADWPNRPRRKIDAASGKQSLTRYRLLAYDSHGNCSRVELEPVTGRTHQLRLHLSATGHPILGDALYGDAASAQRLLLHAYSLDFPHPVSGTPVDLTSEPAF